MGPGFGREMAEAITRSLTAIGVALLVVGVLVGAGCQRGCAYLQRHVEVRWLP